MATKRKQKEQGSTYIYIGIGILIIGGLLALTLTGQRDYDTFAHCLADKGYIMAGTDWCSHCADQKAMFNGAFQDVIEPEGAYKDCDRNQRWCEEHDVQGYPTWITPEGNKITGVQKLPTLARISGCNL